jgi:hypothetical protein
MVCAWTRVGLDGNCPYQLDVLEHAPTWTMLRFEAIGGRPTAKR